MELIYRKGRKTLIHVLADTDTGIQLKECVSISRKLGARLEDDENFQFPYTLEVSSPGTDRPLDSIRLYQKNTGRELQVFFKNGTETGGKLTEVRENSILLEVPVPKSKTKEVITQEIPWDDIKESKVIISFKAP